MDKINKLKDILQRRTKLENDRHIEINIDEISRDGV